MLPLSASGRQKALELGIEGAQSQWHLLDAVLSQGDTLNKADLAAWGILPPSVVSGLSLEELKPHDRPRTRRPRRIPPTSGGGGDGESWNSRTQVEEGVKKLFLMVLGDQVVSFLMQHRAMEASVT